MKIVAVGDTHFGHKMARPIDGSYPSIDAKFRAFEHAVEYAIKNSVDTFVHTGDVFDMPNPSPPIKKRAVGLFEKLLETGMDFFLIPGNYDRSFYENNLLEFYYPNFHVLNSLKHVDLENLSIIGFPYTKMPEQVMARAIRLAQKIKKQAIIICHQIFKGAKIGPQNYVFRNGLTIPKLPSNVPFILSGHIHRSQQLKHVLYTGSLERTGYAETIEPKGFLVINSEQQTVFFKEIPTYPMVVVEIPFEELFSFEPDPETYTLVRIIGKALHEKEISHIHQTLRKYPLVEYTPKVPNLKLYPLYSSPPPFVPVRWNIPSIAS